MFTVKLSECTTLCVYTHTYMHFSPYLLLLKINKVYVNMYTYTYAVSSYKYIYSSVLLDPCIRNTRRHFVR